MVRDTQLAGDAVFHRLLPGLGRCLWQRERTEKELDPAERRRSLHNTGSCRPREKVSFLLQTGHKFIHNPLPAHQEDLPDDARWAVRALVCGRPDASRVQGAAV